MKKVKEGYKMTELGEIPVDWEIYSLNEMLESNLIIGHLDGNHGGLYPKSNEFVEDGVPYIGANCIKDSRIDFANAKYLTSERAKQFKKGVAKNNDVLFAHNATVGPVALLKTELEYVILSTTLTYYRCNQEIINPVYLMYYMQTPNFVNQYSKTMGQTTRNQVPITLQREFKHIIPTKKEQDRISLILSSVDEQIEITDNLIEKTKELKKGLMQKLLTKGIGHSKFKGTEIGRIPEEWEVIHLLEVSDKSKENSFIDGDWIEAQYITDEGIRLIQTGNIGVGNFIDKGDKKFVSEATFKELKCKNVESGDILICRMAEPTGRACVVPELSKLMITAVDCTIVKVDTNRFDTGFINYFLNSDYNLKRVIQFEQGSTRKRISRINLEKIMIPIPKIEEQKQISLILSSVDEQIEQYESKKEKLQELKKGLMQKLLTGKIRVKV